MHTFRIKLEVVGFLFLLYIYIAFVRAPQNFPVDSLIVVDRGSTISQVAETLQIQGAIRSPLLFRLLVEAVSFDRGVVAGDYVFDKPETVLGMVVKMTNIASSKSLVRVTVFEGLHNREVADILEKSLASFDREKFLSLAAPHEGYLYPDTYFFSRHVSEATIVSAMLQNFERQIKTLDAELQAFGRPLKDVVIMASLVEREARVFETRQIIAGILWKRLAEDIFLQVDAVFVYLLNKGSLQLSRTELRTDSPYNTYTRKGLPAGPIANPGLDAIRAVITPKKTAYYFYLSDRRGQMHYARTFEQHKANKARYLP